MTETSQDFIALAVAVTSGNPELERINERGAECVMAVYRLAKLSLLHALDNQAIARTVEQSHAVLRDFAVMANAPATISYAGDTIFICGQLLKASRGVYESAIELGDLMARCGVSETSFDAGLTPDDLLDFAAAFSTAARDPERRDALIRAKLDHIAVRPIDRILERREDETALSLRERILRFYATALVVMRRVFDNLAAGTTLLPHRIKRLSQHLVTLTQGDAAALLAATAMANAHRDDAGRAVQTALLAVALGRQVTADRLSLARLAMAAFMADFGRVRLAGPTRRDRLVRLGDAVEAAVPPTTAGVCISSGGVNAQAALRATVVYEATCLEREGLRGRLYGGKMPSLVQSRILHLVRALLDRLAPRDASGAMDPIDALEDVARLPNVDPALLQLLVGVLGVVPVGSVVELETGEWAVVVGPSSRPEAVDRPRVRVVTDRTGRVLARAPELDLGAPSDGRPGVRIRRVVPSKEARFPVMRVLLMGPGAPLPAGLS
jgi:hypothetical protein